MLKKNCPICNTDKYSKKIYDENLPEKKTLIFLEEKILINIIMKWQDV